MDCESLECITLPLKDGIFSAVPLKISAVSLRATRIDFDDDSVFKGCENLNHIELAEGAVLRETIAALLMEEWKNDMSNEIGNINQILPNTPAGDCWNEEGGKTRAIRRWITSVLGKIVLYKAEHRRVLREAETTLRLALPHDIITSNVRPFLELPSHTFEGEHSEDEDEHLSAHELALPLGQDRVVNVEVEEQVNHHFIGSSLELTSNTFEGEDLADEDEPPAAAALEPALPLAPDQDSVVNVEVEEQVNHHFFDLSSVALSLVIVIVPILMGAIINLVGSRGFDSDADDDEL